MTLLEWLLNAIAIPTGLVVLVLPCLFHAWEPVMSTAGSPHQRYPRTIDQWSWTWLRPWYNNPADGVSGAHAILDWDKQTPYMPDSDKPSWLSQWLWESWRAYCWNQRNSADGLKYQFGHGDKPL